MPKVSKRKLELRIERAKLKDLVTKARKMLGKENSEVDIKELIQELQCVRSSLKYNKKKYPTLRTTKNLRVDGVKYPRNLAEILLWKQGDWQKYRNFVGWYSDPDSPSPGSNIVNWAFTKSLHDRNEPIFDQHALRAIWAIAPNVGSLQAEKCREFLMKSNTWKASGNGDFAENCYEFFKTKTAAIAQNSGLSHADLDKFLMPLGKALKEYSSKEKRSKSSDYVDFCFLSGRNKSWKSI